MLKLGLVEADDIKVMDHQCCGESRAHASPRACDLWTLILLTTARMLMIEVGEIVISQNHIKTCDILSEYVLG